MSIITHVATGTIVTGSAATMDIVAPAGAIGDVLIFAMIRDDYSDGAFVPNAPPVTVNTILSGDPQLGDDSRSALFWAEEDQAASRTYTFDWSATEGFQGVCIRYSGQDTVTPIQASSALRRSSESMTPAAVGQFGSLAFYMISGDVTSIAVDIDSPPDGYTLRVSSGLTGTGLYIADRVYGDDGYPYPHSVGDVAAHYPATGVGPFGSNGTHGMVFVLTNDATDRTISGVTEDKDGGVLVSVNVALMKSDGASPPNYFKVDEAVSDGTTGAYSFTVPEDNDSLFMVVGNLAGSPDRFDVTSSVLTPT